MTIVTRKQTLTIDQRRKLTPEELRRYTVQRLRHTARTTTNMWLRELCKRKEQEAVQDSIAALSQRRQSTLEHYYAQKAKAQ